MPFRAYPIYRRSMPTDFAAVLVWCIPGALVWLAGLVLIFRAFRNGRRASLRGARLTMSGLGFFGLGGLVGIEIAALERHGWPVALLIAVITCWAPVLCFWLATRLRVTPED